MNINRPGYSGQIYESAGLRKHAEFVLRSLDKLQGQFDFVAVTGKSGMAVAFAALAMGADFPLVTIRKGESSHGQKIEGIADGSRYVVVDDLIDSGATLDRIHKELHDFADAKDQERPRMIAAILYDTGGYGGRRDGKQWHIDGQSEPVAILGARK